MQTASRHSISVAIWDFRSMNTIRISLGPNQSLNRNPILVMMSLTLSLATYEADRVMPDETDDDETKEPEPRASAFVSAAQHAQYAYKINEAVSHWLYVIRAAPYMFVNDEVEDEVIAPGGIPLWLVAGWLYVPFEWDILPNNSQVLAHADYQPNPAYRGNNLEPGSTLTPARPADWDPEHGRDSAVRFMNQEGVGSVVGWTGRFPLPFESSPNVPLDSCPERYAQQCRAGPSRRRNSTWSDHEDDYEPPHKKYRPGSSPIPLSEIDFARVNVPEDALRRLRQGHQTEIDCQLLANELLQIMPQSFFGKRAESLKDREAGGKARPHPRVKNTSLAEQGTNDPILI
ncbi:hypothetical protein CDD83_7040 [Cordyceps sp. RAO-2017]|nr:hypothetical protein CDD83_7040 [Cordyceps sp. RAO-2017]